MTHLLGAQSCIRNNKTLLNCICEYTSLKFLPYHIEKKCINKNIDFGKYRSNLE